MLGGWLFVNLIRTSVLVSLAGLLSLMGCLPAYLAHPAEAQQQAYADAMGKPSHPATTAQQWSELEARAAALAQEGKMEVGAPLHVATQGYSAEHKFSVQGGHCYRVGIGWAFDASTQASVMFQPRADGMLVNDFVGGAHDRLENRSGTLEFCADRDGVAALSLSALTASASAKDAETYVTFPNTVRCQACGAEYHIRAEVMKDNTIRLKAELINKTANPKTR